MKFINNAKYITDQARIAEVRVKHRDYLKTLLADGKVVAAGPYADGSGTLIIYDVPTIEDARKIVAEDPFTTENIFVSTEILPWTIVFSIPEALKPA